MTINRGRALLRAAADTFRPKNAAGPLPDVVAARQKLSSENPDARRIYAALVEEAMRVFSHGSASKNALEVTAIVRGLSHALGLLDTEPQRYLDVPALRLTLDEVLMRLGALTRQVRRMESPDDAHPPELSAVESMRLIRSAADVVLTHLPPPSGDQSQE